MGDGRMRMKFKDFEAILISNVSAGLFAVTGVALGAIAYLKFKVPVQEVVKVEIKDTRNPLEIEREKKITKAISLMERKLYKSAEEILSEVIKDLPKDAHILSMLSFSEKKIGRLENAERHLAEAIEVEPGQWALHNNMGILLFEKGKPNEALKSFKKALELSPKNYKILLSQARVLEQLGKFTDARLSYGRAMQGEGIDPSTANMIKDRLKKLDVLAFIERGDK